MKGINKFPEKFFLKYKTKPVKLKPYDSRQEEIGKTYLDKVETALKGFQIKTLLRGSTAFKILGKGEVEIGIYPKKQDWGSVINKIKKLFGEPENTEDNYVWFNDVYEDTEIEIILLKGHEADVDIKLHEYLISHPGLLKEYVEIKKKYAFSKREYQRQKNSFLSKVVEMI